MHGGMCHAHHVLGALHMFFTAQNVTVSEKLVMIHINCSGIGVEIVSAA